MRTFYLYNKARHSFICSLWLNRIGWHFLSTHIFFHGQFGHFSWFILNSFLKLGNYFPALNGGFMFSWMEAGLGFYVLLDGGRVGVSCSRSIPIKSVGFLSNELTVLFSVTILYLVYPFSLYIILFGVSLSPFLDLIPGTQGRIRIYKEYHQSNYTNI